MQRSGRFNDLKIYTKEIRTRYIDYIFLSIISFLIINAAPGDPTVAIYGGKADRLTNSERARIVKIMG